MGSITVHFRMTNCLGAQPAKLDRTLGKPPESLTAAASFYILSQPSFDERLVRHVAFIGFNFYAV